MLSLENHTLELSSLECGVAFDLALARGVEQVAWPTAGGDDAFLALDRDGDGSITNGRELFGESSPQWPSDDPNGFRSLALFDLPLNGGDGDGWITPTDRIWEHLLLWTDRNSDGISTPEELQSLDRGGLRGLDLNYREQSQVDAHGNWLRYVTQARFTEGDREAWDVYLRIASEADAPSLPACRDSADRGN